MVVTAGCTLWNVGLAFVAGLAVLAIARRGWLGFSVSEHAGTSGHTASLSLPRGRSPSNRRYWISPARMTSFRAI
jgi:hypothetical protein